MNSSCSQDSIVQGESVAGTAPTVSCLVIVEQPGPWPSDALEARRLGSDLRSDLRGLKDRGDTKVVLARHPDRKSLTDGRNVWFLGRESAKVRARHTLIPETELISSALMAEDGSEADAAGPRPARALFICTNGARDPCCAVKGRKLLTELTSQAWECSHLGGHRFAPTAVIFPDGLSLGRLTVATTEDILGGSQPAPAQNRGRFGRTAWQQVAEIAVSTDTGIPLTALNSSGEQDLTLVTGPQGFTWQVRMEPTESTTRTSCSTEAELQSAWCVTSMHEVEST